MATGRRKLGRAGLSIYSSEQSSHIFNCDVSRIFLGFLRTSEANPDSANGFLF